MTSNVTLTSLYPDHQCRRSPRGSDDVAGGWTKGSDDDPQIIVTGTIKQNRAGGEILTCKIPFGPLMDVVVIANIPCEGETTAPVYVKLKAKGTLPNSSKNVNVQVIRRSSEQLASSEDKCEETIDKDDQ